MSFRSKVTLFLTTATALLGLALQSDPADAARRDGLLAVQWRANSGAANIGLRKRVQPSTSNRATTSDKAKLVKPKPDSQTSNSPRPDRQRPRTDSNPKPTKDSGAGSNTSRPTKDADSRPNKPNCNGGTMRRGTCQCPAGAVRTTRDGGTCVTVVQLPRPVGPPNIVPVAPAINTTTLSPAVPLALGGAFAPRGTPPPSGPPTAPPTGARPTGTVPFVPSPALLNAVAMPDEVIAAIPTDAPTSVEDGIASRFRLDVLDRTTVALLNQRIVRFWIPDGRLVPAVVAALQQDAAALTPQANYLYRPQQGTGETSAGTPQYALGKVELAAAHTVATGRGAIVGIIDTGVDTAHADFKDSTIQSFNAVGGDTSPEDHGTAIAGIIAARGLTRGIAPGAQVLSVRAFTAKVAQGPQVTTSFILLKSLDWAIGNKARVLNLSFAGPEDPVLRRAIVAANANGVIMVAAAGNNGRAAPAVYPAAYDGVIATTAIDADDRLYKNANVGAYVLISAPGVDILAPSLRNAHELYSGTSFAAAHVTGVIALLLEQDPALTAAQARAALIHGAFDLGPAGRDTEFGAGRVNAAASLSYFAVRPKP